MKSLKIFFVGIPLLIIALAFVSSSVYAQAKSSFPSKTDFFQLDLLGQLYFVNGSELKKYSKDAVLLNTFSNLYLGDITSLDVSDPMNILLYYDDNNQIILLDNQLAVKNSPIDLSELGYEQASLVCLSYNNGFWLFDPISQALIRFNNLLDETDNSGNILNVTGYQIQPVQLIERDNQVILRDNKYGIFVFDRFGNYIKRIPFVNIDDLYIRSGQWQILKNDTNLFFNPLTMQIDTIPLLYNNVNEIRINKNRIYYRNNKNNFFYHDL